METRVSPNIRAFILWLVGNLLLVVDGPLVGHIRHLNRRGIWAKLGWELAAEADQNDLLDGFRGSDLYPEGGYH